MREKTAEREFRVWAESSGFLVVKVGTQGRPDQLVSWGKGHGWLEWKTPRGRLTRAQERRIPAMLRRGERVEVVTNLYDAQEWVMFWRGDFK